MIILLNAITIGILFCIFLFYLLNYFGRKKRYYLDFSILIFLVCYIVFYDGKVYELLFNITDHSLWTTLYTAIGFMSFIFALRFIKGVFNLKNNKLFNILIILQFITVLVYFLLNIFFGFNHYIEYQKYIIVFAIVFTFIVSIILIIVQIKKQKKYKTLNEKMLIIANLIAMHYFAIVCCAHAVPFLSFIRWNYSGVSIIMILFTLIVVYEFTQDYKKLKELTYSLESKVKERTIELEMTNRQKTNLFINLAHETKTPLTLIENSLNEYLKKHRTDDDMNILKQNVDKLKSDMNNFLDAQKIEQGRLKYNNEQIIGLSNILTKKCKPFSIVMKNKNINFSNEIKDKLFIKADPYAIDRIINNLLDNAIKYTNEKGNIKIELLSDNQYIIIKVSDTGIGISKENLKNIFSPYF